MKALMLAAASLALVLPSVAAAQTSPNLQVAQEAGQDLAAFKARRVAGFMRMDTDHDGRVSQAELTAFQATRKHGGGQGGRDMGRGGGKAFTRMDANGDGYLSPAEIGAMAEKRFAKIDANHDGKVVASELQAAHHGRGGGQPTGL